MAVGTRTQSSSEIMHNKQKYSQKLKISKKNKEKHGIEATEDYVAGNPEIEKFMEERILSPRASMEELEQKERVRQTFSDWVSAVKASAKISSQMRGTHDQKTVEGNEIEQNLRLSLGRIQIRALKLSIDSPWVVLGDFNCILEAEERIGAPVSWREMADFRAYIEDCDLSDMKYSGNFYTWNNKQTSEVGDFDHCPGIVHVYPEQQVGKKPFRYFNMWSKRSEFRDLVLGAWHNEVEGTPMYKIVKKLKMVKKSLIELNKFGCQNVEIQYNLAKQKLDSCQSALHSNPAKTDWIVDGDQNTTLFHKSLRKRNMQNRVYTIKNLNGENVDSMSEVPKAFLDYYNVLLGSNAEQRNPVNVAIV
uniref:Uncharacterized protein n=1 Tax=Chenopodium quinoa TaxID=63459 RepID=A0A803LW18_CHEQI